MTTDSSRLLTRIASRDRVWNPVELLEWAILEAHSGEYSLSRSAVTLVNSLDEIPGGPFEINIIGNNSRGHIGLKQTIADKYGARPENIFIGQGAGQCDALIAGAVLRNGGTAIVETPVYEPIYRAAELFADRVIDLPRRKENGFLPDPDELKYILTDDTRVVFLTNLYNPPGIFMDNAVLAELVNVAASVGAVVVTDEVFLHMKEQDYHQHGFSVGSVSVGSIDKSYGLEGMRVGWAVGPEALITDTYRLNLMFGAMQPYIVEDIASQILRRPEAMDFFHRRIHECLGGRYLLEEFAKQSPDVSVIMPSSGINAVIEFANGFDDREFVKQFKARKGVTTFPMSLFRWPHAIRVSFGGDKVRTKEGFRRLREMMDDVLQ